jgi:hypothetical protein
MERDLPMKRRTKKSKVSKPASAPAVSPSVDKAMKRGLNRRDFLTNSALITGAAGLLGGGGWYFASTVAAEAKEGDLSTLGNGVPAIVQIHDPNCPTCNALRREAREAACSFGENELQFKVANLRTKEGRALAGRHGVGKITLLMFDGDGSMRLVLPGLSQAENLKPVFRRHVAKYGVKKPNS